VFGVYGKRILCENENGKEKDLEEVFEEGVCLIIQLRTQLLD
jgi:hypothetical protein